jgi:hypothetical protein
MQRALLPIILAGLGLFLIMWATTIPLFEWKVSEVKSNFPQSYEVNVDPSPWISKLGESLDNSYYTFRKVRISIGQNACLNTGSLNIVLERPSRDRVLESLSTNLNLSLSWLIPMVWGVFILSGIFFWWVIIWQEHLPVSRAVFPITVVVIIFCLLMGILRLLNPALATDYFGPVANECSGTLVLNAQLSRIHYGTQIMLGLGILGEIGAMGIMLRQFIVTIIQGKESAK